jgi:hypothetical protein
LPNDTSPVVCSYAPTRLADEFGAMIDSGRRTWSFDDVPAKYWPHLRHPSPLVFAFDHGRVWITTGCAWRPARTPVVG